MKRKEEIFMRKSIKKGICALLLCVLAAEGVACGKPASSGSIPVKEEKKVEDVADFFPKGINSFSYQVFEKLDTDENIVISPYSMAVAIGMLANGADGETKKEIETLLGIKDLEKWNASAKYYMSLHEKEQTKLLTANSVWLSDKQKLAEQEAVQDSMEDTREDKEENIKLVKAKDVSEDDLEKIAFSDLSENSRKQLKKIGKKYSSCTFYMDVSKKIYVKDEEVFYEVVGALVLR